MGLIGNEIIQSRVWIDPAAPPPPNLNYKHTFPITVFDAVRRDMTDETSQTLTEVLDTVFRELASKQPIFPGRPANYLMTFAGSPGAVGAIQMSREIPWDPEKQGHDRIPTEKAVADFMFRLGLLDSDGNPVSPDAMKVRWSDIIGRPLLYSTTGKHEDGFMTQKATTDALKQLEIKIDDLDDKTAGLVETAIKNLGDHVKNQSNPHHVTIDQIGAASQEAFSFHVNAENPHNINASTIGLENVDNTADMDKPVSNATQEAIDALNKLVTDREDKTEAEIAALNYLVDASYDQKSGRLVAKYRDGSEIIMHIHTDGLIDEIRYNGETKELEAIELSGKVNKVDVSDLFVRYLGSENPHIIVEVDDNLESHEHTIKAFLVPNSVTENELGDASVPTRSLQDQSVTEAKIHDLTITTIKLADGSVTTEKISEKAITNNRLGDRSVNGRTLFSSSIADRILAVVEENSDPVWTQITPNMISANAIQNRHLASNSVSSGKIVDGSIITAKLADTAVTTSKLAPSAVTTEKIQRGAITGEKLTQNIRLPGTPTIEQRPGDTFNGDEIPDVQWVMDHIGGTIIGLSNIPDRLINGSKLFSSSVRNRALVVYQSNSDPVWGLINHEMMDRESIGNENIRPLSVDETQIRDWAVRSNHIFHDTIQTSHIVDAAVTSEKIFPSLDANRVLAAITKGGSPVYTQVFKAMMAYNSVGTEQLEDHSVTSQKINSDGASHKILGIGFAHTDPAWMEVETRMISDRAVTGAKLFTSPVANTVLAVSTIPDIDPAWMKITGEMLMNRTLGRNQIAEGAIWGEHLQEKIIESKHILDWTIQSNNIAPRAITGVELFTSPVPNRVLAVTTMPDSNPDWLQVTTDMIEDKAITKEKIFQSKYPYHVLGVTEPGVPPEYLKITHHFIVDDTIVPEKLVRDFVLYGTPELTVSPPINATNHQIPDTAWVRQTVLDMIQTYGGGGSGSSGGSVIVDVTAIPDHSITANKIFTTNKAPRVLGITEPNGNVRYILIGTDLIENGAVTNSKLQRDLTLMGAAKLEVRPPASAADQFDNGDLIPDCQWVLDRLEEVINKTEWRELSDHEVETIWLANGVGHLTADHWPEGDELDQDDVKFIWDTAREGSTMADDLEIKRDKVEFTWATNGREAYDDGSDDDRVWWAPDGVLGRPGGGAANLAPGAISTELLADRVVNGRKLFTSAKENMILGVTEPNTDPAWMKIIGEMISDHAIQPHHMFSDHIAGSVLTVPYPDDDPIWSRITSMMLDDSIIKTWHIADGAITTEKIADRAITRNKLPNGAYVWTANIDDEAVTTRKIASQAVTEIKIADKAITRPKFADDVQLPPAATIEGQSGEETRSIRNVIISPNPPHAGVESADGDIWIQYY